MDDLNASNIIHKNNIDYEQKRLIIKENLKYPLLKSNDSYKDINKIKSQKNLYPINLLENNNKKDEHKEGKIPKDNPLEKRKVNITVGKK